MLMAGLGVVSDCIEDACIVSIVILFPFSFLFSWCIHMKAVFCFQVSLFLIPGRDSE